ncbi:MAG: hypothetical protein KC506_03060 [Nanoarchaeota archaeon]|nr:hypothetical protein [Nanoarchaeota archaeon]
MKNIREEFIRKFVLSLIVHSYKPEKKYVHEIDTHKENELFIPSVATPEKIAKPLKPEVRRVNVGQIVQQPKSQIPKTKSPAPLPPVQQSKPLKPGEKPDSINLGKLAQVLLDPSVISVECGGPGRTLIVNRSGQIQNSNIMLNKDEIDQVMQNFSDKTRIPLVSGVFRAAFKDLLLTAVISDFVGTRFLIEKRYDYAMPEQ